MLEDGEKPLTLRQQERIAEVLNVEFSSLDGLKTYEASAVISCYYVDEDISRQLLNKLTKERK